MVKVPTRSARAGSRIRGARPADPVAAIEVWVSVLHPGARRVILFDARLRAPDLAALRARYAQRRELRVFYQRLVASGKPKKVALIAVARKLLVHLNALLKPPSHQPTPA